MSTHALLFGAWSGARALTPAKTDRPSGTTTNQRAPWIFSDMSGFDLCKTTSCRYIFFLTKSYVALL